MNIHPEIVARSMHEVALDLLFRVGGGGIDNTESREARLNHIESSLVNVVHRFARDADRQSRLCCAGAEGAQHCDGDNTRRHLQETAW